MGRKTDAFTWPALLRHFSKCLLNLSTWEQPLLPVLDVFGMGGSSNALLRAQQHSCYCAPVWCRSAHTRLIDPSINDALRIVTGCLRPTPADNLPILAGIQPAELRRRGAILSLGRRAMEPGHLLHSALTGPSGATARRLNSRHPFVPAVAARWLLHATP